MTGSGAGVGDRVTSVQTTWKLDPPARVARAYRDGEVEVHLVIRTQRADGAEAWQVKGIPLTSRGNPNGTIDWRPIKPDDMDVLRRRVLSAPSELCGPEPSDDGSIGPAGPD